MNSHFTKQASLLVAFTAVGNRTVPSGAITPIGLCGSSTTLTTFSKLNDVVAAVSLIREQFVSFLMDMKTSEWKDRTRLKSSKIVGKLNKTPIVAKMGRNRRGHGTNVKGMKPTTRECDPMWTYFIMECKYGNMVIQHYIDNMQSIIDTLLKYDWRTLQTTSIAYTTNSSRISNEAMLGNLIAYVLQGYVPHCWLSSTASTGSLSGNYASQGVVTTISAWLEEYRLTNSCVQLHYLMNPHGILQALIEYFAWKNDSKLDSLYIDARILEVADAKKRENSEHGPLEPPSEEEILAAESQLQKDHGGCSLVLRGVKMSNAQWNEHKYSLEFTSRCSTLITADQVRKKIALLVVYLFCGD